MLALGFSTAVQANFDYEVEDLAVKLVPVEAFDAYESPENRISADIEGYLPNDCYSEPRVSVRRGPKFGNNVYVRVWSIVTPGPCAQVVTPFDITANLGVYEDGTYDVTVQPNTEWEMSDIVVVD